MLFRSEIFVCDTEDTFANRCIQILQNPEEYSTITENAMNKLCQKYEWSVICKKYNAFLENVLREKGREDEP